uniref:DNA primase large subunit C-terminal domain-containing protein n=1 Tax=Haptolina ericina TaxID=156174 RepID=A0A7S3C2H3_9EUKA
MPNTPTGIKKDVYSHFILRLAYCRSEDLRRWFLQNETELFKHRFALHQQGDDLNGWLARHNLKYEAISRDEAHFLEKDLENTLKARRETESLKQDHYKVPFEDVLDLVRQRRVFLKGGFAYVPASDLVSIVTTRVRAHLSKQLSSHSRQWPALREEESDRLATFLESLATQYVGDDYAQPKSGQKVSLAELPMLAKRSMPLCMSNMHSKLVETSHLKHNARNQLGLFLKGIGLTVEESMAFWRSEFTKKMPADKWQKEYAYGIRYNYGLEGKRTDWTPHSCMKVISTPGANASAGEHHGCPFKNFDETQMRATLQQMSVPTADVTYILEKVRGQHYQIACGKYFEAKHKGTTLIETELGGISHPNQYFEQSMKFYNPAGTPADAASGAGASSHKAASSVAVEQPAMPAVEDVPMTTMDDLLAMAS